MPACKGRNPLSTLQKKSPTEHAGDFFVPADGMSPPAFAPDNRQPLPHTGKGKSQWVKHTTRLESSQKPRRKPNSTVEKSKRIF